MSASHGGQHCPGPHQCAAWTLHRVEVLRAAESIWQRRDVGTYMRAPFVTAAVALCSSIHMATPSGVSSDCGVCICFVGYE